MKEMLEQICRKQIVFTSLEMIDPKILHTRKKLLLFSGVDLKSYYHLMMRIEQKSRFVVKQAEEILDLEAKIVLHVNHNYKYKHLLLQSPLCSKAKTLLIQRGWKVYNDFV